MRVSMSEYAKRANFWDKHMGRVLGCQPESTKTIFRCTPSRDCESVRCQPSRCMPLEGKYSDAEEDIDGPFLQTKCETRCPFVVLLSAIEKARSQQPQNPPAVQPFPLGTGGPDAADRLRSLALPVSNVTPDTAQPATLLLTDLSSIRENADRNENEKGPDHDTVHMFSESLNHRPKKRALPEAAHSLETRSYEPNASSNGCEPAKKSCRRDPPDHSDHQQSLFIKPYCSNALTDCSVYTETKLPPTAEQCGVRESSSCQQSIDRKVVADIDHNGLILNFDNYRCKETGKYQPAAFANLTRVDDRCVVLGYTREGTRALQLWRELRGSRRIATQQEVDVLVDRFRQRLGIKGRPVFLVHARSVADATYYWEYKLKNGAIKLSYWKLASIDDLQRDINTKRHSSKERSLESHRNNLAETISQPHERFWPVNDGKGCILS